MDDRTRLHLLDQLAGDGWLLTGHTRIGQVTYSINVHEVRTSVGYDVVTGTETRVRLFNHTIDPAAYEDRLLTLRIQDGREISGFISADGANLARTGALT